MSSMSLEFDSPEKASETKNLQHLENPSTEGNEQ